MFVCVCILCMHLVFHIFRYIHTYAHTHTHICTHTHIHIHILYTHTFIYFPLNDIHNIFIDLHVWWVFGVPYLVACQLRCFPFSALRPTTTWSKPATGHFTATGCRTTSLSERNAHRIRPNPSHIISHWTHWLVFWSFWSTRHIDCVVICCLWIVLKILLNLSAEVEHDSATSCQQYMRPQNLFISFH